MKPSLEHSYTLAELLAGLDLARLCQALATLTGQPCALLQDGQMLAGDAAALPGPALPLFWDLEPVGALCCGPAVAPDRHQAAVALLHLLMLSGARYRLAADVHLATVQADFQALQEQHSALQASEDRYRQLNEQLEQRVQDQVKILQRTQGELYQAEKLAAVGQLAAGVAHEINNPLGFISSNLRTARAYVADLHSLTAHIDEHTPELAQLWQAQGGSDMLADFADLIDESLQGAERVAKIVADLKDFSNVDHQEQRLLALDEWLPATYAVLATPYSQRIRFTSDLAPLPRLLCYPGHLGQALFNLIRNAAQAIDGNGHIHLRARHQGDVVTLELEDNGHGIPADLLPRLFEPFFTTRQVGQGTGMGLTIVHDVARLHGGSVSVQSQPGQGSCFTLHLPVVA